MAAGGRSLNGAGPAYLPVLHDTHDEWRELNVGLAPPRFLALDWKTVEARWEFDQALEPINAKVRDDLARLVEEARRKIFEAMFLPPALLSAGPRLGDRSDPAERVLGMLKLSPFA